MPPLKDIDLDELDNMDPDDFEDKYDTPEARGDVVDPNEDDADDEVEAKADDEEETDEEETDEEETDGEETDGEETDEEETDEEETDEEETDEEATDDEEPAEEKETQKDEKWIPKTRFDDVNQRRKEAEQRLAALERQAQKEGAGGSETSRINEIQQELTTLDKKINEAILEADADKLAELRTQERKLNQEAMDFQLKTVTTQAVSEARYDAFLDKVEADFPEYNPEHESYNDELVTETLEVQQAFMARGVSKMDALTKAIRYVRPQYIREDEPAEKPSLRGKPPARDTSTKKARNQKVAKSQPKSPPSRSSKLDSAEDIDVYNLTDPDDLDKIPAKELARLSGDFV